jgi:preprotein translocase subunit SecA
MLKRLINGVFGSRHDRERKRVQPLVDRINGHAERLRALSDDELRAETARFRGIIAERTAALAARVEALRADKRVAADTAERERLDAELSGSDGRGGVEGRSADGAPAGGVCHRPGGVPAAGRPERAGDGAAAGMEHGAL